ncbi:MAG: AAA family ATPase [Clostridia bacterium]|nr:AAA family ATPase [Clostridia bacterium]
MKIDRIAIRDFKALKDVSFSPGRVNVFIGANGSGKSTLLEAIGVLSAAMTDRIDGNSLLRKGIRLSAPSLYKSAFKNTNKSKTMAFEMVWRSDSEEKTYEYHVHLNAPSDDNVWKYHSEALFQNNEQVWGRSGRSKENYNNIGMLFTDQSEHLLPIKPAVEPFGNYAIYQPFTAALRGIVPDPQQAIPIGLNGGRLAEALEEIIHEVDGDIMVGENSDVFLDDILEVIDWADSISIGSPTKERVNAAIPVSRRVLEFQDKFLKETTKFTAYDASEGALYILFMYCLALHHKSPTVFAIDNFDQAMHPRLAKAVMQKISEIILGQSKTVFITTHNPLVLDGLDLSNDDIRLFTMNRSRKNGNVYIERIQISSNLIKEKMSLSQLWTSGRIGGVPDLI